MVRALASGTRGPGFYPWGRRGNISETEHVPDWKLKFPVGHHFISDLCKLYHFTFCKFRYPHWVSQPVPKKYPHWVIWVTQPAPKKYPHWVIWVTQPAPKKKKNPHWVIWVTQPGPKKIPSLSNLSNSTRSERKYPHWVIWVTQPAPKKIPIHSDFHIHMLTNTSIESPASAKLTMN